jgi:hypothetical protein
MLGSSHSSSHSFEDLVGDGVGVVGGLPQFLEGRFRFVRFRGVVFVMVGIGFLIVVQYGIRVDGQVLRFQNCLALVEEAFIPFLRKITGSSSESVRFRTCLSGSIGDDEVEP